MVRYPSRKSGEFTAITALDYIGVYTAPTSKGPTHRQVGLIDPSTAVPLTNMDRVQTSEVNFTGAVETMAVGLDNKKSQI